MKRGRSATIASVVVLVAVGVAYGTRARSASVVCPTASRAIVVVDTARHAMALCESGKTIETFSVRIGRHGTGKTREGDGKTPLGVYGLGEPRSSASYGTFVPVEYPTAEQRQNGFTGGAIGVHGPDRRVRWMGAAVNRVDSTEGCVGIATDPEMARIAEWIRSRDVREIALE